MQASPAALNPARSKPLYGLWASGALLALILVALAVREQMNLLFAVIFASAILLVASRNKAAGILLTFWYLILLGDIRRVVAWVGATPGSDPLLLVGPVVAAALALPLLPKLRLNDYLSKAMLLLLGIMVLEIAKPTQGGISVGLAGAVFYIAPVCWFWVGRKYASPVVVGRVLSHVIFPLATLAAALGIVQTFAGFLPWEQAWIDAVKNTYTALYLGSTIRAFGFSTSAAEYTALIAIASAGIFGSALAGRKRWLVAMPLLLSALILSSSRGYVIKLALAIAASWSLRRNASFTVGRLIRIAVSALTLLAAISLASSRLVPQEADSGSQEAQTAVQSSLSHQAGGLAHPFDPRYSTAGIHSNMVVDALTTSLERPFGAGLGATTAAAARYGGGPDGPAASTVGSSEVDFTDMFLSLGVLGGITYLAVVVLAARAAFQYIASTPRSIALPVVSILVCTVAAWMIGGQYSTSSIIFFLVGALAYKPVG